MKEKRFYLTSEIKDLLSTIGDWHADLDDNGCRASLTTKKDGYVYSVSVTHEQYKDYYFKHHKSDFLYNEYKNQMIVNHCVRKLYNLLKDNQEVQWKK